MFVHLPNILLSIPRSPITAVGLPVVFGLLSGSQTRKIVESQWYKALREPPGRPPRQVFPFVWTLLYISMGYASHLAVKSFDSSVLQTRSDLSLALGLYFAQLGLNFLWSPLFFGLKQIGLALVDCALVTATTIYMTKLLHDSTAGKTTYFLIPYCVWLSFATYLNGGIWWLNRRREDRLG